MHPHGPGKLLSIYVDESDQHHHQPLYMALVERAHHEGLAGATVLRGLAGFGSHRRLHTGNLLTFSSNLPIVIQIVDQADRIERFLAIVEEMVPEGLATVTDVEVRLYRHRPEAR